ncbi:MAG TPA: CZB domain-containing protein [Acidimicrobiia bacterium]
MDGCEPDEIARAIAAHGSWKLQLVDAVRKLWDSVRQAADAEACPFGRWLHETVGADAAPGNSADVQGLHAEFHRLASEVVELAVAGRAAEAQTAMSASSRFAAASAALTLALVRWQDRAA